MGFFSIFGSAVKDVLRKGAVIIDVRTAGEFDRGKVPGSINIPTDRILINIERIRAMRKPIVLCDDSDGRASKVLTILKANGIKDVYKGGSWNRLIKVVKSL